MILKKGEHMLGNVSPGSVIQNLKDAGCGREFVEQFLALEEQGKTQEQLKLLSKHREWLLDRVHTEEKKITCLDYLVYHIQKANTVK